VNGFDDDMTDDLVALIEAGLVAVSGTFPNLTYCLTPEGQQAADYISEQEAHEARVRTETRELAEQRHAAARKGNVVYLFSGQGA
jgi:hypothetical protein